MSEIDRYLRRATRGVWGQKKRDAQTELRGAIDDKIYRARLLGLDEAQAEASALRDLGSPAAIARGLGEVHTAPQTLQVLAFVGVAGLLGFQAAAQVATVRAIPDPQQAPLCTFEAFYLAFHPSATPASVQKQLTQPGGRQALEDAVLSRFPLSEAREIRQRLTQPGGREALTADCLKDSGTPGSQLLRLSDVFAALRAGGVKVTPVAGADGLTQLSFPGEPPHQLLSLEGIVRKVDGEDYVDSGFLLDRLRSSVTVPLRLSGLRNPVLSIGPAKLQLGSSEVPLLATNLYLTVLLEQLEMEAALPRRKSQPSIAVGLAMEVLRRSDESSRLRLNTPDGTLYGLLSNANYTRPACNCPDDERERLYSLSVRAVQGGLLPAPLTSGQDEAPPEVVSSLSQLLQATEKGQRALLVYRLDAADLHHLTYTPVPAAQIHIGTAP
ncbi:hypothetical protein ACFP9V_16750 [Deinococcus radiopugnans]|uniref:Uncharacterized protein n=1 Tax=Deinococcus radiopugnans ATCC 19172 TaxID=585398 RepID=A0A5C4Y726_9DEIO|nr:hypothetical protein [Deinococcus radiopugnans]MBB6016673.1 hypothetical protein [Deinococcus radiopugnans ATCC 19172]TNM70789.1 hypothetical protein FHR04_11495 [Deinococcus radiopugnans ATCC 19172]